MQIISLFSDEALLFSQVRFEAPVPGRSEQRLPVRLLLTGVQPFLGLLRYVE